MMKISGFFLLFRERSGASTIAAPWIKPMQNKVKKKKATLHEKKKKREKVSLITLEELLFFFDKRQIAIFTRNSLFAVAVTFENRATLNNQLI